MIQPRRRLVSLLAGILCAAAAAPGASAQQNALHVEVFGPAVLGSINYERIAWDRVSARVGIGAVPAIFESGTSLNAPVMVNYFFGRGEHRVETGAGIVAVYVLPHSRPDGGADVAEAGFRSPELTGTLAYRWQPGLESRLRGGVYRIGFTPVMRRDGAGYPLFGISAGMLF